jgi:hypothetical protein
VAVRAHNIALRDFSEQILAVLQDRLGKPEALRRGVAMVEVHLVRLEAPAAIGARHPAELSEELGRDRLAPPDTGDLALTIRRVPLDVRRPLAGSLAHAQI